MRVPPHPLDAVPWWLVMSCRNRWHLKNFVETGTGYGDTALQASTLFQHVYTVEVLEEVFVRQLPELQEARNVIRYLGSSPRVLPEIVAQLEGPTFWYIDAHWPGLGPKIGPECPLLDELQVILDSGGRSNDVLMIDNLGLFVPPIPSPLDQSQWPVLDTVVALIKSLDPAMAVQWFADVLVATPQSLWGTF